MPLPRLPAIDSLRGFLLFTMTVNHLPGPHRDYTYDSIGYFTVAEGFVFISGLVAGLHGYDLLRSRGETAMRRVFYLRARTLYLSQITLLALLFGIGCLLKYVTSYGGPPAFSFLQTSLLQDYATGWSNSLHPLFIEPWRAAGAALVLLYQPTFFDVLPMYCLFLFFTPFFICWLEQGRAWLLLLGSFLLWLMAQSHGLALLISWFPSDWNIHDFVFDPSAWQILFLSGLVSGGMWVKYKWTWRPPLFLLLTALIGVGMGYYVRHAPVSDAWKVFLGEASARGTIAPARLISTGIVLACGGLWALRFPAWFTWPPLACLGRNSLNIFLYQIALMYVVDFWCLQGLSLPLGNWLDLPMIALCTSTLWIAAALCDRLKQSKKERRTWSEKQFQSGSP